MQERGSADRSEADLFCGRASASLATLDVYLIQEPELHLRALGPTAFHRTLCEVFEMLERAVEEGAIGCYGLCTWNGFRVPHSEREHLFVRSTPGVTSAVVGMREPDHVDDNLSLARIPPAPPEVVAGLFRRLD